MEFTPEPETDERSPMPIAPARVAVGISGAIGVGRISLTDEG
ncbi:hypothetical protein [Actinomadura nitritigenes]|nr:hypothetical protein [Actinomadura nitritigenes]